MRAASEQIAVCVGPSLERDAVRRGLPGARIEPPIARGDIDRLRAVGVQRFVILDGAFAHELAVAPSEIVAALRGGVEIIGASSIGAIRAAECRPAGMTGIGAVYQLYRLRVISDDDEVAVATEPGGGSAATSTALINIRWMVLAALRRGLLTRAGAEAVLHTAKRAHFSERHWRTAFAAAGVRVEGELRAICEGTDIKRRDAVLALECVARSMDEAVVAIATTTTAVARDRYPGHDPWLGLTRSVLTEELTDWLLGSGRYRHHGEDCTPDLIDRLARSGELEPELMRWYAVRRGCEIDHSPPEGETLARARAEIAAAHGCASWDQLATDRPGRAVPVTLIDAACVSLAQARRNLALVRDPLSSGVGA